MQKAINGQIRALTKEATGKVRSHRAAYLLKQAKKDREAILAIAGLRMEQPDDVTLIITGSVKGVVVNLSGKLGYLGHPSDIIHLRPQLLEASGSIGNKDIEGSAARDVMGGFRHFLDLRRELAGEMQRDA